MEMYSAEAKRFGVPAIELPKSYHIFWDFERPKGWFPAGFQTLADRVLADGQELYGPDWRPFDDQVYDFLRIRRRANNVPADRTVRVTWALHRLQSDIIRTRLRDQLARGQRKAFILSGQYGPTPILPTWWWDDSGEIALTSGQGVLLGKSSGRDETVFAPQIVGRIGVEVQQTAVKSSARAQERAEKWLREKAKVRAYKNKTEYQKAAIREIENLSIRQFNHAWANVRKEPSFEFLGNSGRKPNRGIDSPVNS